MAQYNTVLCGIEGFVVNVAAVVIVVFYWASSFRAGLFRENLLFSGLVILSTWVSSLGYHAWQKSKNVGNFGTSMLGATLSTTLFLVISWAGCTNFVLFVSVYLGLFVLGLFLFNRIKQNSRKIPS